MSELSNFNYVSSCYPENLYTYNNEADQEAIELFFKVEQVECNDYILWPKDDSMFLKVEKDEDGYYMIENERLNIYAYGRTLEELHERLEDIILFLWDTYAIEDEEQLAFDAQKLKKVLLKEFDSKFKNAH